MNLSLFPTLRGYQPSYFAKDLAAGAVIAAVSIPISMGYAEVAGLPAVYGLYGSLLPILCFALFSTSPQFVFGVDAAPAAIVCAALPAMGIAAGSPAAMAFVPFTALLTGLWLLLFYFLRAGKIVNYISTPVMGGFITGISFTIILMQIPKILGSGSGSGELLELLFHIREALGNISLLSAVLGIAALAVLRLSQKLAPKFPMAVAIMAAGVALELMFGLDAKGVRMLAAVEPGLPALAVPSPFGLDLGQAAGTSLTAAAVIMSETLLSENNFAFKNGYRIDDNREILACAAGNLAAALVGCCPVNGSISRTSMNDQFGGKTQAAGLIAGGVMAVILLSATGFIRFLPVPVLAAIVISALMNVVELRLARRLFSVSRNEFWIFLAACLSVLCLGTIYGVVIGIALSFAEMVLKAANPPRAFLGIIPGREGFFALDKNPRAVPVRGTVIYRFSESLFFANIKIFKEDIEAALKPDTSCVIVDAGAVTGLDITAADQLKALAESLRRRGIRFFLTEHVDKVNEEMRKLGLGSLIEEGMVRRTVTAALKASGLREPYPAESREEGKGEALKEPEGSGRSGEGKTHKKASEAGQADETGRPAAPGAMFQLSAEEENSLEEFAWAFGSDTVSQIEKRVRRIIGSIHYMPDLEELSEHGLPEDGGGWMGLGAFDEDEILRRIELHLDELPKDLSENRKIVLFLLEKRRRRIREDLEKGSPELLAMLKQRREKLERRLMKQNPEAAMRLREWEQALNKSGSGRDEKEEKERTGPEGEREKEESREE